MGIWVWTLTSTLITLCFAFSDFLIGTGLMGMSKGDKNFTKNLTFLKLLVKYDFLDGLGETYYASYLLCWSLLEMNALKFVVPILRNEFELTLTKYGQGMNNYGSSPIWAAIRQKENGFEKLEVCAFT